MRRTNRRPHCSRSASQEHALRPNSLGRSAAWCQGIGLGWLGEGDGAEHPVEGATLTLAVVGQRTADEALGPAGDVLEVEYYAGLAAVAVLATDGHEEVGHAVEGLVVVRRRQGRRGGRHEGTAQRTVAADDHVPLALDHSAQLLLAKAVDNEVAQILLCVVEE